MDRILVVDDDQAILRLLHRVLTIGGYQPITATNGREALEQLRRVRPAVILLDLAMPVMDGQSFVRELHLRENAPPVVIITGAHDGGEQAKAVGAYACLAKPFDPMALLETIAAASQQAVTS